MSEQRRDWARFAPTSEAVRHARRFTSEWAREQGVGEAADDAALVVSELAANAVIHARTDFEVHASLLPFPPGGLRVEVRDGSPTLPLSGALGAGAISGRGLPLVHGLASRWGVDPHHGGKGVWAEVALQLPGNDAQVDDATAEDLLEMWSTVGSPTGATSHDATPVGAAAVDVTVADLPVHELLAAKTHMEDLVRELQLVLLHAGVTMTPPAVLEVARRLDAAVRDVDVARLQIRSQALRAAERGCRSVTLELSLPPSLLMAAVAYRDAIEDAETLSREGALASHGESLVRYSSIRHLYLDQMIIQLDDAGS